MKFNFSLVSRIEVVYFPKKMEGRVVGRRKGGRREEGISEICLHKVISNVVHSSVPLFFTIVAVRYTCVSKFPVEKENPRVPNDNRSHDYCKTDM